MKILALLILVAVLSITQLLAQTRIITGTVTDDKGVPIPNASIIVKGEKTGAQTNAEGVFNISINSSARFLVISSVGFNTREVAIGNQTTLQIQLQAVAEVVGEVITTGYTTRRQPTISASEIRARDIQAVPLTNINEVLQGKAPGLQISSGSGQPGSAPSVLINGVGSISANSSPLYVIDGIIVTSGELFSSSNLQQQPNDALSNLNPDDIENVTVLRDAVALALYGSRGSNGVIVITTKKGKSGTSQISFRSQYGFVNPSFGNWQLMNAKQVYDYEKAVEKINYGAPQAEADYPPSLLNRTFDWLNAAFRQGSTQNYELSVSGGNSKTRQYLSLGYFIQQGTVIESEFKRITSQLNVEHNVNDNLKIGVNANVSFSKTKNAGAGNLYSSPILGSVFNSPLHLYPYTPNGALYKGGEPEFANYSYTGDNFLYSAYRNFNQNEQFRGLAKLYGNLKLTDWLTLNQNVSVDIIYLHQRSYTDPTTSSGINAFNAANSGSLSEILTYPLTITSQTSLTGNFNIKEKNAFDYLLLTEYQKNTTPDFSATGIGLSNQQLKVLNVAPTPQSVTGGQTEYAFLSYLGQLNYTYNNKYSFSGSLRRDGSSRFGANKRYANFFAVGAAWRMMAEPFMKKQKIFSDFRIRFSYGVSGNAEFQNYAAQSLYSYSVSYNGFQGSVPSSIGNANLTWEKSSQGNLGFEMAFIKGRIRTTIELYRKVTSNLLQNVPISATSGFTTYPTNVGKMRNEGVNLSLNTINIQSKNITWFTNIILSTNANKVISLYNNQTIINLPNIIQVGKPVNAWYVRQWAGVDPANGDPLWLDANGKPTNNVNKAVRIIAGIPYPKITMNLANTINYKAFELSFSFYGVTGNKIFNSTAQELDNDARRFGANYIVNAGKDFWTTPGQKADRPKPVIGGNKNSNAASTRYLENGSYIRLRTVTLAYNFPNLKKIGISNARFYIVGANLLTITKYTGVDPEIDASGFEFFKYPVSKSITVGLDVSF